jgi:transposase
MATAFFTAVRAEAEAEGLVSDEHFTVDGTLLEAWASLKSFSPSRTSHLLRRTIRAIPR